MMRLRRLIGPGAALVLLLGLVSNACAGSLTLVVTAADGNFVTITGGPFGTVSNGGNSLTVTSIAALNTFLSTNGSAAQFTSLSASSNFAPGFGNAAGSFVTQAGSVYYDQTLTGSGLTGKVTVQAFQTGFVLPSGPSGTMQSSATANFTEATAGSSASFTSTYNSGTTAAALLMTSTGDNQNDYSPSNLTSIPTFVTPFELSNTTVFNLVKDPNFQSTDGFSGSTTVTTASVPEPGTLGLLLTGNIFLVFLTYLRRRGAAA